MHEGRNIILGMVAATAIFFGGTFYLANWGRSVVCANTTALMGKPHQYGFLLGCMVEIDGEYIPLGAYKVMR